MTRHRNREQVIRRHWRRREVLWKEKHFDRKQDALFLPPVEFLRLQELPTEQISYTSPANDGVPTNT